MNFEFQFVYGWHLSRQKKLLGEGGGGGTGRDTLGFIEVEPICPNPLSPIPNPDMAKRNLILVGFNSHESLIAAVLKKVSYWKLNFTSNFTQVIVKARRQGKMCLLFFSF